MNQFPLEVETKFYQVLTHRISISEFEQWLYQNSSLNNILSGNVQSSNLYFELISLDYTDKYIINELHDLLDDYVEMYKFQKSEVMEYLQSIIDKDEHCGQSILMTYELYCDGYNFLRKLGLEYGLCLIDDYDLSHFKNELKEKFYPNIIEDAQNALNWLKADKIIFKNVTHESSKSYLYDDLRNETEVLQGELTVDDNKPMERLHQFFQVFK